MTFNRFLPDYGTLPSAYFERSSISNPIELFWSDELQSLLRLCGEKEDNIGKRASDYDKFCAVLRALPLLQGHPTRAWIATVFANQFGLQEVPSVESAQKTWRMLCDKLFENPIQSHSLVSGAWLSDALRVPNSLPQNIAPVLNANLLLDTKTKTIDAWSAEIASAVAHFASKGCQNIVLKFSNRFEFVSPSLYHVNQALNLAKRNTEIENLLMCQLMRELCTVAREKDLLLVLECDKNADALASLLAYAEESVGLPCICWSVRKAWEAKALLDFSAKTHKNEIFAAMSYESAMTERELLDILSSWQMRYPVGRLCFVTAMDLRQTPFAQTYIEDMLKNAQTNI